MSIVRQLEEQTRRRKQLASKLHATTWFRWLLRKLPVDYMTRLQYDAMPSAAYGYGVYCACLQAKMLEIDRITAIEFGVAGGNGLVNLESYSEQIGNRFGIAIDVYGFDTGEGMPRSEDYRDALFVWPEGAYRLDEQKLRARLRKAELVIGDVGKTVPEFIRAFRGGPIGFVSFDVDYYSSTMAALEVFNGVPESRLPRTLCYFDDLYGDWDLIMMSDRTGQHESIRQFNESHPEMFLGPVKGLAQRRPIPAAWNEKIYALHDFRHPRYNDNVMPISDDEFKKRAGLRG